MNPTEHQLPQPLPHSTSNEQPLGGLVRYLLLAFALVGLAGLFVNLAHASSGAAPVAGATAVPATVPSAKSPSATGPSATGPSAPSPAATTHGTPAELEAVAAGLRAQQPGTRIDSVQFSPIAGLYEVVMGRNVAYMDASGRYALFGHVWDMQTRRDLTADRKALLDRIDVKALDKSLALRQVKGRGTRTLYVFADPQCSFCRQQEQALSALDDVTIYTYVLPILGPESRRLATAVACADDPQAAWTAWMLSGQAPTSAPATAACAGSGAAVEQLAKALGITGTPTLVAEDGRKSAGAMPASQLASWLGAAPAAAAAIAPPAAASPKPTRAEGGVAVKVTTSAGAANGSSR
jgi:thiol:disulfide interchange protein DsbC